MDNPSNYTSLAEFILDENDRSSLVERTKLVRILSRSSTLPKVEDIFIKTSKAHPNGFFIVPGKAIHIGSNFLSKPIAALLCLRYGLEWQIWYKNQSRADFDPRLCDIAACRVAAKFHELTPAIDRSLIDRIPPVLAENMQRFKRNKDASTVVSQLDFEALQRFHHQEYPDGVLSSSQLSLVNHLASPVEDLMMSGGDIRLTIDSERLLNKYGCRPFPRPEAFTFASSTASSISNAAYNKVQHKRKDLIKKSLHNGLFETLSDFTGHLKKELKKSLSVPKSTEIILASSGTDVSLQVAGLCLALFGKKLTHILVASDETGSGVPLALQGCHFSSTTALGKSVEKGQLIEGFQPVTLKRITLRDDRGRLKALNRLDDEVKAAVDTAIANGNQPVLHAIDQSKLGYAAPSDMVLQDVKKRYGDQVTVTIDNSQLRMDPDDINTYLQKGYLMTVTGSKFFTGPPFSGALLIPSDFMGSCKSLQRPLPKGLTDYFYRNQWPDYPFVRFLSEGINPGLKMRWYAAIAEIKRYYKTPLSLRVLGIDMFCRHVKTAIDKAEFLDPLPGFEADSEEPVDQFNLKVRKTIFPFFVKDDDRVLSKPELDRLYRLLNRDLSKKLADETEGLRRLAGQSCHIGQPVAVVHNTGCSSAVVRINLGARVISESWKDKDSSMFFKTIEEQMIQVDIIIRKIEMIVNHGFYKTDKQ